MTVPETVTLLIVEDDEVEAKGMRRALGKARIANPVIFAKDGVEALEVLRGEEGHDPLTKPYLVLLDLNMPRMGGIEFLAELREDPIHKDALVFVLTTSKEEEDRVRAYDHNVAGYIVKNDFGAGFLKVLELIQTYWRVVEFPL
ncbi:MAG: response regulator [Planctomycetota bacterium]